MGTHSCDVDNLLPGLEEWPREKAGLTSDTAVLIPPSEDKQGILLLSCSRHPNHGAMGRGAHRLQQRRTHWSKLTQAMGERNLAQDM